MRRVSGAAAIRLLFFLAVAIGVVGMHTLGHPSHATHADTHGHPGSAMHRSAMHRPPVVPPADHLAGNTAVITPASPDLSGSRLILDPSSMCLAVLVAFAVAALFAALLSKAGRKTLRAPGGHGQPAVPARGPPSSELFGLRLADLSVHRR